jgi:hypothetical protein
VDDPTNPLLPLTGDEDDRITHMHGRPIARGDAAINEINASTLNHWYAHPFMYIRTHSTQFIVYVPMKK